MAKNYSDNLSEEVRKGMLEKASQGIWPSVAPIGYRNRLDTRTIELDLEKAPLQRAFRLAATGQYSLARLKKALFRCGLRSAWSGLELGKQAMARVLRNPFYHGEFIWAGRRFKGTHPALVTLALYNRVQETMGFVQKPRLTKHEFAYSGLLSVGTVAALLPRNRSVSRRVKRIFTTIAQMAKVFAPTLPIYVRTC